MRRVLLYVALMVAATAVFGWLFWMVISHDPENSTEGARLCTVTVTRTDPARHTAVRTTEDPAGCCTRRSTSACGA